MAAGAAFCASRPSGASSSALIKIADDFIRKVNWMRHVSRRVKIRLPALSPPLF